MVKTALLACFFDSFKDLTLLQAPINKRARPRDRFRNVPRPTSTVAPSIPSQASTPPSASTVSTTQHTKKAKRQSRHDALLHKISASAPGRIRRRRRKTTALPDLSGMLDTLPDWEGFSSDEGVPDKDGKVTMTMRTLKSKRGAGKAKARLEKSETQRFGNNMAAMAAGKDIEAQGQDNRWAALREFIGRTMESSTLFKE